MDVVVLTTTFYKNVEELRFHLAAQMMGNAVAMGYTVVVVDGSPDVSIRAALRKIGVCAVKQRTQGMGESRRELFRCAGLLSVAQGGEKIFLWTEPEKADLIRFVPQIIAPIERGEADIVIPERTMESWETYPEFQRETEQKANFFYAKATNRCFDPMFGPIAFKENMLPYFAACNPSEQFGVADNYIQHIAPLQAIKDGHEAVSVRIDFLYPLAQRKEEEGPLRDIMREKRIAQRDQLSDAYYIVGRMLELYPYTH